jgi:hypothetical protein
LPNRGKAAADKRDTSFIQDRIDRDGHRPRWRFARINAKRNRKEDCRLINEIVRGSEENADEKEQALAKYNDGLFWRLGRGRSQEYSKTTLDDKGPQKDCF